MKSLLLATAALSTMATAALAQQAPDAVEETAGDIIITATKRATPLQDVPIAVTAVTSQALKNAGITDIRELTSLAPSLVLTSSASEAAGTVARIRGIGTVGDNQGLESSVAVFIDGVYRSRNNVGLTELGEVERIEVLRGPQGTLFGRNASAGLINVITKGPKDELGAYGEATYGNYNFIRLAGGVTGGIGNGLAARLDANFSKRDGFFKDALGGEDHNDRNRWLLRGQLGYKGDALDIRIIGDYSRRREDCCTSSVIVRGATAGIIEALGFRLSSGGTPTGSNPYDRVGAVTPGRSHQQDVDEWGVSAEANYDINDIKLTSITAYRDWKASRGQDADFTTADILYREDGALFSQFKTFSQEFRANGTAFDDRLDWLVGAYYANEKLATRDALKYGAQFQPFANALIGASTTGFGALNLFIPGAVQARLLAGGAPASVAAGQAALVAPLVQNAPIAAGTGTSLDRFNQTSNNWALFTHNTFSLTEQLKLTVGARYTEERKSLDGSLASNNSSCQNILNSINAIAGSTDAALGATSRAIAIGTLNGIRALPCVVNPSLDGLINSKRKESQWTGTAVLSYKIDDVLTYFSYSKGYKAGGFNLDRAGLSSILTANGAATTTDAAVKGARLQFEPEKVNAYEVGAKYASRIFTINGALFMQDFSGFQLNAFDGLAFTVSNIGKVKSKGVEVDVMVNPVRGLTGTLGVAVADTKYNKTLVGPAFVQPTATTPAGASFQLPGARLTNAPLYSLSGSLGYRAPIADDSLVAGVSVDFRYMSDLNSGSDLDPEKNQDGGIVLNARATIGGEDERWSLELWSRNLLNRNYTQIAFDGPGQGSGTRGNPFSGLGGNPANTQTFNAFLAEPRTFGVTARYKF
jgi:iron complex outermembrane recepter protein